MLRPKARTADLIIRKLDGETLIHCRRQNQASCLNAFAATVFDRCDGETSPREIAQSISADHTAPVAERAVWLTLDQLSRRKLLEQPITMPAWVLNGRTRREALRTLGAGSAAAIPAIASIMVPRAVEAASCTPSGSPCSLANPGACCSLTCVNHGGGVITCA